MTGLRPELETFADAMERVLRRHDGKKSTWKDKPIAALLRLLILEVEELKVALEFFTPEEAQHECVDVANFAMMLFDRLAGDKQ